MGAVVPMERLNRKSWPCSSAPRQPYRRRTVAPHSAKAPASSRVGRRASAISGWPL